VGQYNPLEFVDHVYKLFLEEINVFKAGAMRTSSHCFVDQGFVPVSAMALDWCSMLLIMKEELACWMVQLAHISEISSLSTIPYQSFPSLSLKQCRISINALT